MACKTLLVNAISSERNPLNLADKIEKTVKDFLDAEGAQEESRDVSGTPDVSGFGNALVTVTYKPKEEVKKAK